MGISKSATQDEIKKAYKKKAKLLHPDRHPNEREKYQALFQDVQKANETLKDPQKRALYDKYGEKGVKRGGGASSHSDLISQMFGHGRASADDNKHKKSPAIKTVMDVTLEDIYVGAHKKLTITRRVAGNDSSSCGRCKGLGRITQIQRMGPMMLQQQRECPDCNGIGFNLQRERYEVDVHIPVGGRNGETVCVHGEGHQYPEMEAGDINVQLRQKAHDLYKRQGADLGMNYELSLRQALCGYKIKIAHVSGKELVITPSDGKEIVQPGSLKRVHCLGLPQRFAAHVKGHLYIVMDVKMPLSGSLSDNSIKQFAKLLPNEGALNEYEDDKEDDDNDDDDKEKSVEQKEQQQTNANGNNTNKNGNTNKKGKNNRNKKGKKRGKNNRNKGKNKKNQGKGGNNNNKGQGVFGGLHGFYDQKNKKKNDKNNDNNGEKDTMEVDNNNNDDDEMIEEVECHTIDGNPKATPAAARNYHQEDDDEEGVQCRQM